MLPQIRKSVFFLPKAGSVVGTTALGYSYIGMDLLKNSPYGTEIGIGVGITVGSLLAYAVSDWEKSKGGWLPILLVGGALGSFYSMSSTTLYESNLREKLSEAIYTYESDIKKLSTLKYDIKKETIALQNISKISSSEKVLNQKQNKYNDWVENEFAKIETIKTKLDSIRLDSKGNKSREYVNQVRDAVIYNKINHIVDNIRPYNIGGLEDISKIFFEKEKSRRANELEVAKKEQAVYLKNLKLSPSYSKYESLTEDSIRKARGKIMKRVEAQLVDAKSKIKSEEELKKLLIGVGILIEVILAPFQMWINLVKRLSSSFSRRRETKVFKEYQGAVEETALSIEESIDKAWFNATEEKKSTTNFKRAVYLAYTHLNGELSEFDKSLTLSTFKKEDNNSMPKHICFKESRRDFNFVKDFILAIKRDELNIDEFALAYKAYSDRKKS